MAQTELERRFEQEMRDGLPELKRLGYNPTYFIRMMNEMGAAGAIRALIDSPNESEGFTRLWEMGRLDLSAEAVVADQPQWVTLFTPEQRQKARRRLEQVNYQFSNAAFGLDQNNTGTDWTEAECAATVADYFAMLAAEIFGTPYSKADHNRRLRQVVNRSQGSIEFKHANISAVLNEMQQPYLRGYNPRGHYQRKLAEAVGDYLDQHPDFFTRPEVLAMIEPTTAPLIVPPKLTDIFDEPPEIILPDPNSTPWLSMRGRRVNFAERDARNRQLGRLGEEFTLAVERRQLVEAGRDDLAGRVEWIADTRGDGVGFDVLSYDAKTEAEKWIEVKTTGLGKYHPFMVTAHEVRCSEAEPDRFHLYRVFEFRASPRVFVLPGALSARCELRPTAFIAAPRTF